MDETSAKKQEEEDRQSAGEASPVADTAVKPEAGDDDPGPDDDAAPAMAASSSGGSESASGGAKAADDAPNEGANGGEKEGARGGKGVKAEAKQEKVEGEEESGQGAEAAGGGDADKEAVDAGAGGGSGKKGRKSKRKSLDSPQGGAAAAPAASDAAGSAGGGREKRARKTLEAYVPVDFTKVDRSVNIIQGRGSKIGDLRAVRESIEGSKDPAVAELAHKFLFGGNKKPPKDSAIKANLLAFSGYLPPKPDGVTEKELEAMDKKVEVSRSFHPSSVFCNDSLCLCTYTAPSPLISPKWAKGRSISKWARFGTCATFSRWTGTVSRTRPTSSTCCSTSCPSRATSG
jgi:hypothetical protein